MQTNEHSESTTTVEQIELDNIKAQAAVKVGEALNRLWTGEEEKGDFTMVIKELYLKEYPIEIAEAIASNTGAYDEDKLIINLKGVNSLQGFFSRIGQMYNAGLQTLNDNAELLATMSSEEAEE